MTRVFISYTQKDRQWAEWVAWQVEAAGHEVRIQAWDFKIGGNFVHAMNEATTWADVTMPVLSPAYLDSGHCTAEWSAAFAKDPLGEDGSLLPVRVQDFDVPGLLGPIVYIDLVDKNQEDAAALIVDGLTTGRRKPSEAPPFPGAFPEKSEKAPKNKPAFPRTVLVDVPHRNPHFTGRETLLADLHAQLQQDGTAALAQAAIFGLGGIGKTQTAIEYVHRLSDEYRFVFWVAAETETGIGGSYQAIFRELKLGDAQDDLAAVVQAVKGWLSRERGWLLVFDNADEPAMVRDFLPPKRDGGKVLLTSRAKSFKALGIKKPFRVRTLAPEEAIDFLITRTESDERGAAAELAEELGYLPLALEQAAAYVDDVGVSLGSYLASFKTRKLELLEKGLPGEGYPASVATTWDVSIKAVAKRNRASVELLNAAAFLVPDSIPIEIFTLGGSEFGGLLSEALEGAKEDPLVFRELLEPLERYSLVERLPDDAFRLHRLTQEVAKGALGDKQKVWAEDVVKALNAAFLLATHKSWSECERLQVSVLSVISTVPGECKRRRLRSRSVCWGTSTPQP